MKDVTLETPDALGIVRIRVLDPRGKVITAVSSPGANTTVIRDAPDGVYHAFYEPVGGEELSRTFEHLSDGDSHVLLEGEASHSPVSLARFRAGEARVTAGTAYEITPQSAAPDDPLFFMMQDTSQSRSLVLDHQMFKLTRSEGFDASFAGAAGAESEGFVDAEFEEVETFDDADDGGEPLSDELVEHSGPRPWAEAMIASEPSAAPVQIGLAHDEKPYDPGGWLAVETLRPRVEARNGVVVLTFDDDLARALGDEPRLRLSVLSGRREDRMLVPLFAGGVEITISMTASDLAPALSVRPLNAQAHTLTQMLDAGTSADMTAEDLAARLNSDDPWMDVLARLTARRLSYDLPPLHETRTDWMTDALILRANDCMRRSVAAPPTERARAWAEGLALLRRARRVGAPYFGYANFLAADLLCDLVAAEFEGESERSAAVRGASREQARWHDYISRHGKAGAVFTWWLNPRARRRRGFDGRYVRTIWSGEASRGYLDGQVVN